MLKDLFCERFFSAPPLGLEISAAMMRHDARSHQGS